MVVFVLQLVDIHMEVEKEEKDDSSLSRLAGYAFMQLCSCAAHRPRTNHDP